MTFWSLRITDKAPRSFSVKHRNILGFYTAGFVRIKCGTQRIRDIPLTENIFNIDTVRLPNSSDPVKRRRQMPFIICLPTFAVVDLFRFVYPTETDRTVVILDLGLAASSATGFDVIAFGNSFCFHFMSIYGWAAKIAYFKSFRPYWPFQKDLFPAPHRLSRNYF